ELSPEGNHAAAARGRRGGLRNGRPEPSALRRHSARTLAQGGQPRGLAADTADGSGRPARPGSVGPRQPRRTIPIRRHGIRNRIWHRACRTPGGGGTWTGRRRVFPAGAGRAPPPGGRSGAAARRLRRALRWRDRVDAGGDLGETGTEPAQSRADTRTPTPRTRNAP